MKKILLSLSVFMVLHAPAFAVALSDMRTDARYAILDTTATSHNNRYSDSILNYRLNETMRTVCRETMPLYTYKVIASTSGQMEYTVSTDTAKIDKVVFMNSSTADSYRKLTYATVQSLEVDKGTSWEQLSDGLPTHYYVRGNKIGLVPPPSAAYAQDNAIKVYYYEIPDDMASDSDQPFNGEYKLQDYAPLVVLGTVVKCKKDKGGAWQDDQKMYDVMLQKMQIDINSDIPDSKVINVEK